MGPGANEDCEDNEIVKQLKLSCERFVSLKKHDNIARRDGLKEIERILISYEEVFFKEENHTMLLDSVVKLLVTTLGDESEKCREISAKILNKIADHFCSTETLFLLSVGPLVTHLGKSDEREASEVVRSLEIDLMYKLLQKYNGDMLKHLDDVTNILCACIIDNCPEIKRKACECTTLFSYNQRQNFHMVSSSFLKPLFLSITHQHFRTRAICVYAIGSVMRFGNSKDLEEVCAHLAQRLFDHAPFVRTAVTVVIGDWLVSLSDRYSFFHHLIPLMLSSLHDEVPDVNSKALSLWHRAGDQYLKENENYKDLVDFPRPEPDNYPIPGKRPPLGCRILVQRNLFNILPPLLNDLSDWISEVRVISSKVLYSLILHAEEKATMQLQSIIEGIVTAAKDQQKESVEQAIQSAELLGFFIEPNLLCDNIMTIVNKSPSAVNLSIFAAVLRGSGKALPQECFQAICKFLSDPSVARLREPDEQANLLLCIEGLLSCKNKIDSICAYQIFTVISSVSGMTTNNSISEKASSLMEELAVLQSCSCETLYREHAVPFLQVLIANNELWTPQSPEMLIFYFIVQSDYANKDIVDLAIPVMTNNLHQSKDAKLRSKVFFLLIKVFKSFTSVNCEELTEKILDLIRLGVFPNLTWVPGKAASSLRTIAVASLYEIISKNCISECMLKLIGDELLPLLATLSDDDEVKNRLLSCKILEFVLPKLHGCIDEHKIHSTCYEFLKCMDDESDEIRIMTTRMLKTYMTSFPKDYNWNMYLPHIKHVYENVLVHMDDKNEKVRLSVLSFLKEVAFAAPKLLLQEIESKKYMMAAGDCCDDLIEHIKNLNT